MSVNGGTKRRDYDISTQQLHCVAKRPTLSSLEVFNVANSAFIDRAAVRDVRPWPWPNQPRTWSWPWPWDRNLGLVTRYVIFFNGYR